MAAATPEFNWLTLLIGFSEGDGAILTYKGRPTFVITPKETEILLHIKKVLGFGIVREYKTFSRYFVLDKKQQTNKNNKYISINFII